MDGNHSKGTKGARYASTPWATPKTYVDEKILLSFLLSTEGNPEFFGGFNYQSVADDGYENRITESGICFFLDSICQPKRVFVRPAVCFFQAHDRSFAEKYLNLAEYFRAILSSACDSSEHPSKHQGEEMGHQNDSDSNDAQSYQARTAPSNSTLTLTSTSTLQSEIKANPCSHNSAAVLLLLGFIAGVALAIAVAYISFQAAKEHHAARTKGDLSSQLRKPSTEPQPEPEVESRLELECPRESESPRQTHLSEHHVPLEQSSKSDSPLFMQPAPNVRDVMTTEQQHSDFEIIDISDNWSEDSVSSNDCN